MTSNKENTPENIIAAKIGNTTIDLDLASPDNEKIEFISLGSEEGNEILRHSTAHLMAQAILEVFPDALFTIGPPVDNGFYYDIDLEESLTLDDLDTIEDKMKEISKRNLQFVRQEINRDDAIKLFEDLGQKYKVEMIKDLPPNEKLSIYTQGDFIDLCRGPHVPSTDFLNFFKLLNVAGAYWRGDENNKMLQRIYGISFPSRKELDGHLTMLDEAKKRDHRTLGKQHGLFLSDEVAGSGLIYWQPKGTIIRKTIERFWEDEHVHRGYDLVSIPHIVKDQMFHTSGHYEYYRDNMYVLNVDENEYVLKPMNCPGHILIYQQNIHSYRDLPIRYAELGTVYRYERSGTLHGMLRVRGFTQDDAHIFCTPQQAEDEVLGVIDLAHFMLETFGYTDFITELSVHDSEDFGKYAGVLKDWETAETALINALEKRKIEYKRIEGEAAFYGPKIDIKMLDALGRGWQGPTIQFDFNLPNRFNLNYVSQDGERKKVVMIHRTVLGSMERFVGGLIEQYSASFPTWLSPFQARVMTITDEQIPYGEEVLNKLKKSDIRADTDFRNEKISYKIREAESDKVPYMLVVGAREAESSHVSVRVRGQGNKGSFIINELIDKISLDIKSRTTNPRVD
ncbi:MAG: threonine--tRNA ligase [Nitrospinota bacterium]|nr:threonine--tRNA ligase [Nitrospinota bacterium]